MKNKLLALLAAFGLVASVSAVEINDNLSINGFIDGSWSNIDQGASDENDLDVDEVELNFIVNAGNVSGEIHIDSDDGTAGNPRNDGDIDLEQVHFTYTMDNGLSVTLGRFGSALGFEGEDPAGLYTFSRAYADSRYNLGDTDNLVREGVSFGYSADAFSLAISAVNAEGTIEETAATNDDLDLEIAITYNGIENLVIGAGMHSVNAATAAGDEDYTNIHAAYTMDKLMLAAEYVNIDDGGASDDSAYLILADYDVNDKFGVAARYSEYEVGAAQYDRVTVAPNYAITDSLGAILEYSSSEVLGGDEDMLALELTFTF
jgi:hypothetical protein